jgi:hypothetical protein
MKIRDNYNVNIYPYTNGIVGDVLTTIPGSNGISTIFEQSSQTRCFMRIYMTNRYIWSILEFDANSDCWPLLLTYAGITAPDIDFAEKGGSVFSPDAKFVALCARSTDYSPLLGLLKAQ